MLDLARAKAATGDADIPLGVDLRFEQANALSLPYGDHEFDAATVGFGARNFSDLRQGLGEMARVVRPGGRVVVLEITTPTRPPLSTFLEVWFDHIVPDPRPAGRGSRGLQLPAQLGPPVPAPREPWPRSCGTAGCARSATS